MVEDPLSERLLFKEFRAGDMILVDAEPDPDTGERIIVFHATPGFEPPALELAETGSTD
jgi:ATP-dependent Clp protease ATP-binding subunit ClpC